MNNTVTEFIDLLYIVIAGLFTIFVFSFIWKVTDLFSFVCNVAIGYAVANQLFVILPTINSVVIQPLLGGDITQIIPLFCGLASYIAIIKRYQWINRYSVAAVLGAGVGAVITGMIKVNILDPILISLNYVLNAPNILEKFMGILGFIGLFCVIGYFIYTKEQKGGLGIIAQFGRLFMFYSIGTLYAAFLSKYASIASTTVLRFITETFLSWF